MCARFVILDEGEIAEINKIVQEVGMKYDGKGLTLKTGEIRPTDNAPVVSLENSKPSISLMQWGFPKRDGKGVIINARAETASQKKMFTLPLTYRRCVIPSTGFIEWEKSVGKSKRKYRFNTDNDAMLYMAGVYTDYEAQDGLITNRFVILTRQANDSMDGIHTRMPVILYKNEISRWLTDYPFASAIMRRDTVRLIYTAA